MAVVELGAAPPKMQKQHFSLLSTKPIFLLFPVNRGAMERKVRGRETYPLVTTINRKYIHFFDDPPEKYLY